MAKHKNSRSKDTASAAVPAEICEECFSDLVQPTEARALAAGSVLLSLRCPECEHVRTSEYSWDDARVIGRSFAAGKASLRNTYDEIVEENFRDDLDCFVLALASDLIGPDDFTPFRFGA